MVQIEQIFPSLTWRIRHETMYPDKPFDFVKLKDDFKGYHFGLYLDHKLTGAVSLFIDGTDAQFRKLAILPEAQGKGLGRCLIRYLIDFCRKEKITRLWCNARLTATEFYRKNGFETEAEPYLRNQIRYIKMTINL